MRRYKWVAKEPMHWFEYICPQFLPGFPWYFLFFSKEFDESSSSTKTFRFFSSKLSLDLRISSISISAHSFEEVYFLKLWEFTRLFIAMACVNLIFLSQEPNSNEVLQLDTRGFNAAFSHWIPSVSVEQFTVQMFKLNWIGKTHRKHHCRRT